MATRKYMRKTRKHRKNKLRKSKRRHIKRGGGFFDFFKGTSVSVVPENCDPMKLTQLKTSNEMRNNYQTCCPKKYFGLVKDSSPYCKQLDLNFKSAVEREGMEKQYVGMEPVEVAEMKNAPMLPAPPAPIVDNQMSQAVGGRMKRRTRRNRKHSRK